MATDFVTTILADFRVASSVDGSRLESRSGAGIRRVRTADGGVAYLKVTPAGLGPESMTAARRELSFYRHLAADVPLATPPLLRATDTDDGVALLLGAAGEAMDAEFWTPDRWADLGLNLARLHSMRPPTGAIWHRPDPLSDAIADPDLERITGFWASSLPRLADLLALREELADDIAASAPVFIHGDCHTHNIVHSAHALVFCDWQAAGIGRPLTDLALVSVRATPSGVTVPPTMVGTYLDNRPDPGGALPRALLAEELAIFVYLWPPYAAYNSPAGNARVRERTSGLAARWLTAVA